MIDAYYYIFISYNPLPCASVTVCIRLRSQLLHQELRWWDWESH